jgi:hypothetical protein
MANVLVFPCGSEIGLEIQRAFVGIKDVKLIGASSVPDHGRFVFEHYHEGLPAVDDDAFVKELAALVKKESIDFIFPAHDSVVLKLAEQQVAVGCPVIGSAAKTCRIARSKRLTYQHFKGTLRSPEVFNDLPLSTIFETHFPLFLKPDVGQGSKGTFLARGRDDLAFYLHKDPSLLILEYLPGDEYTIDCFTDYEGTLRFHGPRRRTRIINGISVGTECVAGEEFAVMAEKINKHLPLNGAWFFQAKRAADGKLALMEIAPRIGGSSAVYRMRGVNFPVLSYYNQQKIKVAIDCGDFSVALDRAWSNRYRLGVTYNHVYLDFDDCVCIDGKLSAPVMRLIVASINAGIKVHLLSKCAVDLEQKLNSLRIRQLFDTVTHIGRTEDKTKYIAHRDAIFIDDSFAERHNVHHVLGIPVFAVDAVEGLLRD